MNKKSIVEVIKRRSSWRSFDTNSSIPHEIMDKLKEYINSESHVGPFGNKARFEVVKIPETEKNKFNSEYGTYGFIKGAEFFIAGVISKNNRCLEDFGYLFERIILKATELNLGTCWLGGTFKRTTFSRDLNVKNDEIIPAVSPLGIPSKSRRPLGKIIRSVIRAKVRKPWADLFYHHNFSPITADDFNDPLKAALEMVRLAPSAKNKQPWRIIVDENHVVHLFIQIEPKSEHVLNYQKLDIGIAMSHFDLTMHAFKKDGKWKSNRPRLENLLPFYHYVASWEENHE